MSVQIGLQLYTVREHANADPVGTLRRVAEAGYAGVEFAGYYGIPAKEMKALLDETGLIAAGSHVGLKAFADNTEAELAYADEIGLKNLTIPSIPMEEYLSESTFEQIERTIDAAKKHGITLSFHNHHREFEPAEGEAKLDIFYRRLPQLKVELDTYWAAFAGADPLTVMETYRDRLFTIHIKDMKKDRTEQSPNANIGEGILDIPGYLKKAGEYGLPWAIVEMDRCDGDELACVQQSRKNLSVLGY